MELSSVFIRSHRPPQASPAVQRELMGASIVPLGRQRNLLMMAIAGSVWLAIYIGQSLRMAEVAGSAQGKVKGHRNILTPIVGYLEVSAHHEIGVPPAPVGVRGDGHPVTIIYLEANGRRF